MPAGPQTKDFPTGHVVSIVTGFTLSPEGARGFHDILDWMTGHAVTSASIPDACDLVRPHILAAHPGLETAIVEAEDPETGVSPATSAAWLARWTERYGATLAVPRVAFSKELRVELALPASQGRALSAFAGSATFGALRSLTPADDGGRECAWVQDGLVALRRALARAGIDTLPAEPAADIHVAVRILPDQAAAVTALAGRADIEALCAFAAAGPGRRQFATDVRDGLAAASRAFAGT